MDALSHFSAYLQTKGIRNSLRRSQILETFTKCERHVTVNELVALVHKKYPEIGIATIYRTLKLICESGIARASEFETGRFATSMTSDISITIIWCVRIAGRS